MARLSSRLWTPRSLSTGSMDILSALSSLQVNQKGTLPSAGDYVITVGAARGNTEYIMKVEIQ